MRKFNTMLTSGKKKRRDPDTIFLLYLSKKLKKYTPTREVKSNEEQKARSRHRKRKAMPKNRVALWP